VSWRYGQRVSGFLLRKQGRYVEEDGGGGLRGLDWRGRDSGRWGGNGR